MAMVMHELAECRKARPEDYIRINGDNRQQGDQSMTLSFLVERPKEEPGFFLNRMEAADRQIRSTTRPYAAQKPPGHRDSGAWANGS